MPLSRRSVPNHVVGHITALSATTACCVTSRLRHLGAGSPPYSAETGSLSYRPTVRFQLLPTPPRDDAVTFSYGAVANSDRDSHPASSTPSRAYTQQRARCWALPSNAWFGGRRQRTADLRATIGNQACMLHLRVLRSGRSARAPAYAALAYLAAPSVALRTTRLRTPIRLRVSGGAGCTGPARLPSCGGSDFDGEEALSTPTSDSLCVPRCLVQPRRPRGGTTAR